MKELLINILSTVKEEYLCGTLPNLDVDMSEYGIDNSECDTEIHTILSGFKSFRKDQFSGADGLIVCLDVCISSKSDIPNAVCMLRITLGRLKVVLCIQNLRVI